MSSLIDALPGLTLPIAEVNRMLASMWQVEGHGQEAPSEFRASQMNLILHFGRKVTEEEAREVFGQAITFAQRYPCRIIVLCPEFDPQASERPLEAKLYTQCFIGRELRNMCCVEALMLAYFTGQAEFLENQVSVWLENDLPVYYWFHRMSAQRIRERFMPFLRQCRRVLFDASVEEEDYFKLEWPKETVLHDLAYARALPLRQALGQYLSAIEPEAIATGLRGIQVRYGEGFRGEGWGMLCWFGHCAIESLKLMGAEERPELSCKEAEGGGSFALELVCDYGECGKVLRWALARDGRNALLQSDFGNGLAEQPMRVRLLPPEKALAEALFFE